MASLWYPTAKITRSKPFRRNCLSNNSRNGRPATSAIGLGAWPITLRRRRPAPPHIMTASGVSGIDDTTLRGQRFIVHLVGLVNDYVTASGTEGEGNA